MEETYTREEAKAALEAGGIVFDTPAREEMFDKMMGGEATISKQRIDAQLAQARIFQAPTGK